MNAFEFLSAWYQAQCNGNWEHQYGVRISTLDNPGWHVRIDLTDTTLENMVVEFQQIEKSDNDWFGYSVKGKEFNAYGDPQKLEILMSKFREIAQL